MNLTAFALLATIPASPVAALAADYQYINSAADDTLYFGKQLAKEGDIVVINIKVRNNPDDVKPYDFNLAFNCQTKQFKDGSTDWEAVPMDKVAGYWFQFACKK